MSEAGRELLARRAAKLPVMDGKHVCHSDFVPDEERTRVLQDAVNVAHPATLTARSRRA